MQKPKPKEAPTRRFLDARFRPRILCLPLGMTQFVRSNLPPKALFTQSCHPERNTVTRRRRALLRDLPLGALRLLDFGKWDCRERRLRRFAEMLTKIHPCQGLDRLRFGVGDSSLHALRPRILCLPLGMTRYVCSNCIAQRQRLRASLYRSERHDGLAKLHRRGCSTHAS